MPDYTKYDFNESKELSKNRLVLEVVQTYINEHPNISYEELKDVFPDNFSKGNLGVIKNEDEIIKWEKDGRTEKREKRFFSNNNEVINFNNQKLYVSSQWGGERFDRFLNYVKNELGYKIDKSNDTLIYEKLLEKKTNYSIKTKNIMLYGAPGVGKTHNYKRLISMIEKGSSSESEIFETIKNNDDIFNDEETFETIKKEKRVEFVTFHQSYSYEDFIEGFRPNENGEIELDKKGGIFKRISDKARENLEESKKENVELKEEVTFQQKLNNFIEKLENEIEKNGFYQITEAAYINSIDADAFRYNIRRDNPTYRYDLRMKFEDFFEFEKNKVSSRQDVKKLETINSLANQHATYYYKVFNEIVSNTKDIKINEKEIKNIEQKNFYIVIDEINRGNISKIFGELITLIEEDKRDSYEVTLPYSKEKFKIPSNLYIIATMNSTDKSIATIDIALRRRFTFLKMYPNSDLVQYKQAKELMISLNQYIKEKLGEDYQLGHSYFMKISNDEELNFVKEYKIKPLLEEYFYAEDKTVDEILDVALTRKPTESLTAQEFMEEVEASN